MAEQIIQEIDDRIQNKKKLSPALPEEDAPIVNIRNIKMPSPPTYKVGEKVFPSFSLMVRYFKVQECLTGWQEVLCYPLPQLQLPSTTSVVSHRQSICWLLKGYINILK